MGNQAPSLLGFLILSFLQSENEPHYEKTGFLHMRKQRHRSVSQ